MRYVVMPTTDIRRNLATEQYLMQSNKIELPFMLFYIQKPCIIVGRNQNTFEEINEAYCRKHQIVVTRRLSGGGAMYDDLGNLSFSFVVPADRRLFGDFKQLVAPVVTALHAMGATGAAVTGRNDIVIAGKKFSGNAMYTKGGKTFCHGTLMFNVDLAEVTKALNVPADKIASKGIKSVRSRVTNLMPYLDKQYQGITTADFRDALILKILKADSLQAMRQSEYHLDSEDEAQIEQLVAKYYANWDWVYGNSPQFTVKKRKHFKNGTIDVRFLVEKGLIQEVTIYGDFFGTQPVSDLQAKLKGLPFKHAQLSAVLEGQHLDNYFAGIPQEEVLALFTSE
ncbi:lipoate--protein ligase [Liquorilactobacillus satsumensis]|nr:lipoate--protein ligase [Liquorilactobacillus satsumensis]MCP9312117.1 lipoate--protein ligase [Liquorilactobacillus satsumensis]MCP9359395.1 lipoate--protein ligase [Liquorilactobacillus satsumensis]